MKHEFVFFTQENLFFLCLIDSHQQESQFFCVFLFFYQLGLVLSQEFYILRHLEQSDL